jgi:hypothetical protein
MKIGFRVEFRACRSYDRTRTNRSDGPAEGGAAEDGDAGEVIELAQRPGARGPPCRPCLIPLLKGCQVLPFVPLNDPKSVCIGATPLVF